MVLLYTIAVSFFIEIFTFIKRLIRPVIKDDISIVITIIWNIYNVVLESK